MGRRKAVSRNGLDKTPLSFATGRRGLERRLLGHGRHTPPAARPETGINGKAVQTLLPVEMAFITTLDKTAN
jgi:hypothetical protein